MLLFSLRDGNLCNVGSRGQALGSTIGSSIKVNGTRFMMTICVLLILLADTGRISPVAMVLEVKGRAMFGRTPGEEKPIRLMDLLSEKDRVVTDRDAEISLVFLGDGHRETIKGTKAITVD